MEIERFKRIIKYSKKHKDEIDTKVKQFCEELGIDNEKSFHNLFQLVRELLAKKEYLLIELPFKDKEIGAIWYKNDYAGYILLNTSLPEVNVNFALGHELYHVFHHKLGAELKVELYMNEHYYENEEELAANLFSSALLMPEGNFKFMYKKFLNESPIKETSFDEYFTVLVKLVNYFKAPYMAVLLRCYELGLLADGEFLEKFIDVSAGAVRDEFVRLWYDIRILEATKKDDYEGLLSRVRLDGWRYVEEGYFNERALNKALGNMEALYNEIKGD